MMFTSDIKNLPLQDKLKALKEELKQKEKILISMKGDSFFQEKEGTAAILHHIQETMLALVEAQKELDNAITIYNTNFTHKV